LLAVEFWTPDIRVALVDSVDLPDIISRQIRRNPAETDVFHYGTGPYSVDILESLSDADIAIGWVPTTKLLPPDIQMNLLDAIIHGRRPTREDWLHLTYAPSSSIGLRRILLYSALTLASVAGIYLLTRDRLIGNFGEPEFVLAAIGISVIGTVILMVLINVSDGILVMTILARAPVFFPKRVREFGFRWSLLYLIPLSIAFIIFFPVLLLVLVTGLLALEPLSASIGLCVLTGASLAWFVGIRREMRSEKLLRNPLRDVLQPPRQGTEALFNAGTQRPASQTPSFEPMV
jgi:hypothetical protein